MNLLCTRRAFKEAGTRYGFGIVFLFLLLIQFKPVLAQDRIIHTYQAVSIFWKPTGASATNACTVRYKKAGGSSWKTAQNLIYIPWASEYRGSVVNLVPGTNYEYLLELSSGETKTYNGSTKLEAPPVIGRTITLSQTYTDSYTASFSGTANAYTLYQASPSGTTINVSNASDDALVIDADYVVVRGLTVKGGRVHNIRIADNRHHVVIEECDISIWGQEDRNGFGKRNHCAIHGKGNRYVYIQGNYIHDPRWDANTWDEDNGYPPKFVVDGIPRYYPIGTTAIGLRDAGAVIVRYNEIRSPNDQKELWIWFRF